MMKISTTIIGVILALTAIIGFFDHRFLSMDLNPMHDVVLLVLGAVALYFGIAGTEFQARNTNRVLGIVFALVGIATLLSGKGAATAGGVDIAARHVLKLIPNHLEYTTTDGVRDLIVGIIGLVTGFLPRQAEIEVDMKAMQHKVPTAR